MIKNKISFEVFFKQNELRFQYYIRNLEIGLYHEFFYEGIVFMWQPYRQYQPDLGPMATYFNYVIRRHLIRN
ncbi:hypothetical protein [Lentibacillus amyloliquefaciens]|nr:hypothetical protein [Lentibacillus amyloliquefaciens]